MTRRRDPSSYEVGCGKPPPEHRFKPGASGNPKGRPKGTRNLKTDLEEELKAKIVVREGNRETRVSRQQAVVKRTVAKALSGDTRSAQLVLDLIQRLIEPDGTSAAHNTPLSPDEAQVLDLLRQRLLPQAPEAGEEPEAGDDPDQPAPTTHGKKKES